MYDNPYDPVQAKQAFEELRADIEAVQPENLRRLNVDAYQAGVRGVGIAQEFKEPDVGAVFDELPARFWDGRSKRQLGKLAWALLYTVTEAQRAGDAAEVRSLPVAIADAGMRLRRDMLKVLEYNLGGDPEMAALVARLRAGTGYFDLAEDLQILARLYQDHAGSLAPDRFYQASHAVEADRLVAKLLEHLGAQKAEKTWQLQVRRSWTLFAAAYEEVHRVANFIFYKDPLRLARFPNLYAR